MDSVDRIRSVIHLSGHSIDAKTAMLADLILIETNLKKIADHATQLPWAECARLAREALDR